MEANSELSQPRGRGGLASPSFIGLLLTQFLGTLNDNMFRWFVVPLGKDVIGSALALSLGLFCFTLPYPLLAAPAGYLADRFSKRTVIVGCKIAEVVLMILGVLAVLLGSIHLLFAVVMLMGAQAALFAPSKYGSIAEILRPEKLTKGNGLMGLVTIVSSAVGFVAGNGLFVQMQRLFDANTPILTAGPTLASVASAATAFISVALLGLGASLMIRPLPIADLARRFPKRFISGTLSELRLLAGDRTLFRTALGIAFFWFLASLAQMNIDSYGTKVLALGQENIGPLLAMLVVGVGLGSVLAGLWSGDKVELGIVPLGAAGICVSAFLLYLTGHSLMGQSLSGNSAVEVTAAATHRAFVWSCVWLTVLGVSAGLFDIPLESYLQQRSEVKTRGTILAAANFIAYSFMLVAAGLFWLMQAKLDWSAATIFLVAGLGTVPVAIYVVCLIPQATVRCIVWILSKLIYRLHVRGLRNLPERGGAPLGRQSRFVAGRRAAAARVESPHPDDRLVRLCFGLVDQLADADVERDPHPRDRRSQGPAPLARHGDGGPEGRRSGLHFRRGGHHPHGSTAAVPARLVANRRGDRLPGNPGVSGRALG